MAIHTAIDRALVTDATGQGASAPEYMSRRTFAIISHPDAGKTTLTEKLLLESGSIRLAGEVKARGDRRRARSDWMEIERQRGISISSSVMTFEHGSHVMNLLDTPGHADFSEDTFRTLTAVDSAIMVLDAAKGIESQTLKLFEVCRLRNVPIITFINKVDRESLEPLALVDEIMDRLALDVTPMTWPFGMGDEFRGLADLAAARFVPADGKRETEPLSLDDPRIQADPVFALAFESLQIARENLPQFDVEGYRQGHLSPVFFGSALRNHGIRQLLAAIGAFAPPPRAQPAVPEPISPDADEVTGFVFKVQANMDPNHRDRIAFVRLCSGKFQRGMKLNNVRTGRELKVQSPMFFFARERGLVEEAVAGDVIGIPNHGTLSVGDTLSERSKVRVANLPNFAPEIIRRVRLGDASKAKKLARALSDLSEEGVVQVFRPADGAGWYLGAVGALQFDVLVARAEAEYGVRIELEPSPAEMARWLAPRDSASLNRFLQRERSKVMHDRAGNPVFFARNDWDLAYTRREWPDIEFLSTCERGY
jgi:peptide chain release factor 3